MCIGVIVGSEFGGVSVKFTISSLSDEDVGVFVKGFPTCRTDVKCTCGTITMRFRGQCSSKCTVKYVYNSKPV